MYEPLNDFEVVFLKEWMNMVWVSFFFKVIQSFRKRWIHTQSSFWLTLQFEVVFGIDCISNEDSRSVR